MNRISRLLSRLAALGLFVVAVGLAWLYVVEPMIAHVRGIEESIDHNRRLISQLTRSIDAQGEQDVLIADLTDRIAMSGHYVRADTEALAAAEIRNQLLRSVNSDKMELKSFQALPSTEDEGLTRVNVRVVLDGEFDAVIEALYRLEAEEPYLFIDDLRMKMVARRRGLSDDDEPIRLSVVFQLSGFLQPKVGS